MSLPCSQEWQPIIVPGIVSCFDEASASSGMSTLAQTMIA